MTRIASILYVEFEGGGFGIELGIIVVLDHLGLEFVALVGQDDICIDFAAMPEMRQQKHAYINSCTFAQHQALGYGKIFA